jgi:hypothetical protein
LKTFVSALLATACLLVVPSGAMAATYIVNSTGDAPDNGVPNGVCETVTADECTLRAAITEANSSTGVADEIVFAALFNGENGDTISAATALPTIVDQVSIRGKSCDTAAGIKGPCGGVIRAGGGSLLVVEDDDVEIQGLALNGATTAINVINASAGFVAKGNWIGFDLTGVPSGNLTGIFLDPNSDGATIGGPEAAERNVIGGNAGIGLDLEGASDATIQGNYFGVTPKGDAAAPNPTNIEITDSTSLPGFPAENNEVGATVAGPALASAACDGGCNVISGATGNGLDLNGSGLGEKPASGPTTVHGNFVGLNAAGTAAIANAGFGIWAGGADQVTVGGSDDDATNYIAGGSQGIVSENGEAFEAVWNQIGRAPDGTDVAAPDSWGIFVLALGVSEEAMIEHNDIRMVGGVGIEHRFAEGRILDNDIEGGSIGILYTAEPGGGLIAGNLVEAPSEFGILLESPNTDVRENDVFDAGGAGIRVKNPDGIATSGSLIGNDTTEGENLIVGSGGAAIEIVEAALEPGSITEIARNRGSDNGGPFIDLVNGANEGIAPPTFTSATKSQAEGTAEAGATVRVFRKASAEAGELAGFLGEAEADGSGKWKVSYPAVAGGTRVAATQTAGGTSELATANVPPDPNPPTCADTPAAAMCMPPAAPVTPPVTCAFAGAGCGGPGNIQPLEVTITKGPKARSAQTTATFKFKANVSGSTFECKLDGKPFKKCKSPKKYQGLKPGKHVFKVRAKNPAGNVGKVTKRKFTVLP